MEILDNVEVRWFFDVKSAPTVELGECFKNAPLENDGDRVDHYYVDPARPDLNAKARGGDKPQLECNYRVGSLGSIGVSASVTGDVESWTKLSLSTEAGLSKEPKIITVSKQRRRCEFAFDGTKVEEVGIEEAPDGGPVFTALKAVRREESRKACTFGSEAFGPSPVSPALLMLGGTSIPGNTKPLGSLTKPIQTAEDNGVKRALIPIENKRNFFDFSADIMGQVDRIVFCDPTTAAMKVPGLT